MGAQTMMLAPLHERFDWRRGDKKRKLRPKKCHCIISRIMLAPEPAPNRKIKVKSGPVLHTADRKSNRDTGDTMFHRRQKVFSRAFYLLVMFQVCVHGLIACLEASQKMSRFSALNRTAARSSRPSHTYIRNFVMHYPANDGTTEHKIQTTPIIHGNTFEE